MKISLQPEIIIPAHCSWHFSPAHLSLYKVSTLPSLPQFALEISWRDFNILLKYFTVVLKAKYIFDLKTLFFKIWKRWLGGFCWWRYYGVLVMLLVKILREVGSVTPSMSMLAWWSRFRVIPSTAQRWELTSDLNCFYNGEWWRLTTSSARQLTRPPSPPRWRPSAVRPLTRAAALSCRQLTNRTAKLFLTWSAGLLILINTENILPR